MAITVHKKRDPNYVCYACTIDAENTHRNQRKMMMSFEAYEAVVEFIEGLPKGAIFTRVSVWDALGRGYKLYSLSYLALRDMAAHGILECAARSKDRRKCLSYRKIL